MPHNRCPRGLVVSLVLTLASATLPLWAGPLEGRWRLVEQSYGKGSANLASVDAPLRLEFFRDRASLSGRIWADERSDAMAWPAVVAGGTARALQIDEMQVAPDERGVRARYRVQPAKSGDLLLEIREEYEVVEKGRALVGRVEVRFLRDGTPRGSYVLHRRFEREP